MVRCYARDESGWDVSCRTTPEAIRIWMHFVVQSDQIGHVRTCLGADFARKFLVIELVMDLTLTHTFFRRCLMVALSICGALI